MNKDDIVKSLYKYGFSICYNLTPLQAESEYAIDLEVLKDISLLDIPTQFITVRDMHFKNEWHDEKLTQINAYILKNKVGLGTVKKLVQDVTNFLGINKSIEWKSEYIEYLVPAMEALIEDRNPIAGGFVRNNIMSDCGLDNINAVVTSFIVERL